MSLDRPTSPIELNLVIWTFIIVLLGMGIFGLIVSNAPNIPNDESLQLHRARSLFAIVIAGLIYGIKRFLEWYVA